jgi:hypothetical protein
MPVDSKLLRKFIFDYFFEHTRAPVLEEVMRRFGLDRQEAYGGLRALEADHHILLVPGTQRILMANPYSGVTTPFRVHIDGRQYFANCAWDTVSMHVMLDRNARVESYCHHCAEPIGILLNDGKVVSSLPKEPLVFLSMPVARWYENLVNTCSNNMVYFSSNDHMNRWLASNAGLTGEALTPEKMAEVCRPLSRRRMELDYQRPPKEELMAYWGSVGMTSAFWKF